LSRWATDGTFTEDYKKRGCVVLKPPTQPLTPKVDRATSEAKAYFTHQRPTCQLTGWLFAFLAALGALARRSGYNRPEGFEREEARR